MTAKLTTAALLVTLVLGTASVASAQHRICFYVDDSGLVGHTFVQLLPTTGSQAGREDLVYGKYSGSLNIFGGTADMKWDKSRRWDWRICYDVTCSQYNAVVAKIRAKLTVEPDYNLLSDNCTDWITDAATAAGLVLPDKFWIFGIATPGSLDSALESLGDGGTFMGGTVEMNTNTSLGADGQPVAFNAPYDYDAEEVALASHSNPVGLAGTMNLPLFTNNEGSFTTTLAAGFTLNLSNVNPGSQLLTVDWGDGSVLDGQVSSFFHQYPAPGIYGASLGVVDSGAVRHHHWTVDVSAGSLNTLNIAVPSSSPAGGSNPGFDGPPVPDICGTSVPALSEGGAVLLAFFLAAGGAAVLRRRAAAVGT